MKLPYFPDISFGGLQGKIGSIYEEELANPEFKAFIKKSIEAYYPWEKFSQLKLPLSKFSHLEVWSFIKLSRISKKEVAFLWDKEARPFWYMETDYIRKRLHEIDLDFSGNPILKQADIDTHYQEEWAKKSVITSFIEEALHSSQIEGAAVTRRRAKELIRAGEKPKNKYEKMVLNNYQAIQKIKSEWINEPMSIPLLLKMHHVLTQGTIEDEDVGGFRKDLNEEDRVVVYDDDGHTVLHDPPAAHTLEDRMQQLCDFINGEDPFVHPILKAVIVHFAIGYIHPFYDGNGRLARGLFYWLVLKKGYRLFEFISISEQVEKEMGAYKKAYLYTEHDHNDLTYFIYFHLKVIEKCVEQFGTYTRMNIKELNELRQKLKESSQLNERQLYLLNHALKHSDDWEQRYTIESHQMSNGISWFTSRADLLELVEKGFLKKRKSGKKFIFDIPQDLKEKIDRLDREAGV